MPAMSFIAVVLCLCGVCLFLDKFNRGVGLNIEMLHTIFQFKESETEYLNDYRIWYSVLATVTLAIGFMVLLTDYLHTASRVDGNPVCQFCEGAAPCVLVRN